MDVSKIEFMGFSPYFRNAYFEIEFEFVDEFVEEFESGHWLQFGYTVF